MTIEITICFCLVNVLIAGFGFFIMDKLDSQKKELGKLRESNDLAWDLLSIELEDLRDLVIMQGSSEDKDFESRLPCATPDQLLGALHDKMHTESDSPKRVSKNRIRTVKGE